VNGAPVGLGPFARDTFARDHLPPRAQWPELLVDRAEFDGMPFHYPPRLNCAAALLDGVPAADAATGGRIAIYSAGGDCSYAALRRRVDRIAHVLRADLGLIPGQRVMLRGANTPMTAACLLAILKAGCIAVPTMPQLRARELAPMLVKARVNAVLCAEPLGGELRAAGPLPPVLWFDELETLMVRHDAPFEAADTAADDVCLIAFTSGTTGEPKATMHFHRDVLAICDAFPRSTLQSRPSDIFIGTPPLAFTFGLGGLLLFPLRVGAATVLLEKLTPDTLLGAIARYRATVCFTAPTFYRQMAALVPGHDVSSLRRCVSAGEPLPPATRQAWLRASGLAMIDGIGSTEMLHIFISAADDDIRPGATGKPIPGYRACILDAAGLPVGPGVIGRLAVKGPTGCRYLDDARQTDYVLDGWNLTGDSYEMDADGYFYYRARTDDMIISAGYNIAGPEVEEALLRHPLVAECAVIGRADEERGQIVEAHVVLKPDAAGAGGALAAPDLEALARILQDFVKEQIAPYKYPRAVRFLPSLPRTETGKLQRYKLRGP
jgi:2-aminobenzoate-CoA ligase